MIVQLIIVVAAVLLDQFSKVWMVNFLTPQGGYSELWPGVFNLLLLENKGAAFGMLQNARWFFVAITCITLVVGIVYIIKVRKTTNWLFKISTAMIIGGAVGNLIDRIDTGIVIDFFYFELINFAVFNVADSFVSVGSVLLGIYIIFFHEFEDDKKKLKDENKAK